MNVSLLYNYSVFTKLFHWHVACNRQMYLFIYQTSFGSIILDHKINYKFEHTFVIFKSLKCNYIFLVFYTLPFRFLLFVIRTVRDMFVVLLAVCEGPMSLTTSSTSLTIHYLVLKILFIQKIISFIYIFATFISSVKCL